MFVLEMFIQWRPLIDMTGGRPSYELWCGYEVVYRLLLLALC
jgi:hypothetical protein